MAARRTNGCLGRRALTLLALCTLLLHDGVVCDETTVASTGTPAAPVTDLQTAADEGAVATSDAPSTAAAPLGESGASDPAADDRTDVPDQTDAPGAASSDAPGAAAASVAVDAATSVALDAAPATDPSLTSSSPPYDLLGAVTVKDAQAILASFGGAGNPATGGPQRATPAAPSGRGHPATLQPRTFKDAVLSVVPTVECVEKALTGTYVILNKVPRTSCEETKTLLRSQKALWCSKPSCHLQLYQEKDSTEVMLASPDADPETLERAVKQVLPVDVKVGSPSSSSSVVFASVLSAGLLLAAALIGGYCLRRRRGSSGKGMRLAEDSYPVDEETQGNTLVSVAPLTTPADPQQEKPSANGAETPDAAKTQPAPPTNGHSAKVPVADTEL